MPTHLAVPLDGSALAEQALPIAVAIARDTGAQLHLVHVRRAMSNDSSETDGVRRYLNGAAEQLRGLGIETTVALVPDEPPQLLLPTPSPSSVARLIVEHGETQGAHAIVMTTHGRGGLSRKWFGSVADGLLRESRIPLILVKPDATATESIAENAWTELRVDVEKAPRIGRVLIAIAPDDPADDIVATTHRIIGSFEPHYTLLRVLPLPYTMVEGPVPAAVVVPATEPALEQNAARQDLAKQAEALPAGRSDIVTLIETSPARAILDFAEANNNIDLIAVGTHSRSGLDRLLLGSVADKVVRGAPGYVLVIPPA